MMQPGMLPRSCQPPPGLSEEGARRPAGLWATALGEGGGVGWGVLWLWAQALVGECRRGCVWSGIKHTLNPNAVLNRAPGGDTDRPD
jgi:hypothetical protein